MSDGTRPAGPEMRPAPALIAGEGARRRAGEDRDALPCRSNDPELWFGETPEAVEIAKALCGACPVRSACLTGALERREPWGVWGGHLFLDGVVIPRKRPRGRPRKHGLAA